MCAFETDTDRDPAIEQDQFGEYHAVSPLAVFGLILGGASALAMIGPLLWLVAGAGIVVSLLALKAIAQSDGSLVGRKAAMCGFWLSLFFFIAAVTNWASYRYWIRHQAQQTAQVWFEHLAYNEPLLAHQLTMPAHQRQQPGSNLLAFYRNEGKERGQAELFVADPAVRALLALGTQARIAYWATEEYQSSPGKEMLSQVYAVTYQAPQGPNTFFVRLILDRLSDPDTGRRSWRISVYDGGVTPFKEG